MDGTEMVNVAVAVEFRGTLTNMGLIEAVGRVRKRDVVETETGENTTSGLVLGQLVTADGRLTVTMESPVAPFLMLRVPGEGVIEKLGKTQSP